MLSKTVIWLDRIVKPPSVIFHKIGGWAIAVMMVLIAADVFLRNTFNFPIIGSIDITECLMPILVTSALAYVAIVKSHINADVLICRLSQRHQIIINIITSFLGFGFCLLVSWRSFVNMKAVYGFGLKTGVLFIPLYPFVGVVGFGMALLTLVLLKDFLELLRELKK